MDEPPYIKQPVGADAVGCGIPLQRFLAGIKDPASLSSLDWCHFYDFVVAAYGHDRDSRHRVSELSDLLRDHGLSHHANLAVLYAPGLYILARQEKRPLYRGGFNP